MVQPQTVDLYLSHAPSDRRPALGRLRELARRALPDHEERIQWGMPAYVRGDRIVFGFAQRKQFVSLYFFGAEPFAADDPELGRLDHGRNCLRFRNAAAIDWDLVQRLLAQTGRSSAEPTAARGWRLRQ